MQINSSSGAINIGNGDFTGNIDIGNSASARTIIVGQSAESITTTEVELNGVIVDINAGSNGLDIDASGVVAIDASGDVTIDISARADAYLSPALLGKYLIFLLNIFATLMIEKLSL